MKRRTLYIDLYDYFQHLFALFNRIYRRNMHSTPRHTTPSIWSHTMNTKLILALTLSVLAANTFAADGYDRTGSAAFTTAAAVASDGSDHTGSASFASDGSDHTGAAKVAADGADHVGAARLS